MGDAERERCLASGKVCYTRADAKVAAVSLRRRALNKRISVYKCPDWQMHPDGQFHVGHTPSRRSRRARKRGTL